MTTRRVVFKTTANIRPCPKCGNKTEFTICSERAGEDFCHVWAQCKCGYELGSDDAFEDVWGGVHNENVIAAISCWNDALAK